VEAASCCCCREAGATRHLLEMSWAGPSGAAGAACRRGRSGRGPSRRSRRLGGGPSWLGRGSCGRPIAWTRRSPQAEASGRRSRRAAWGEGHSIGRPGAPDDRDLAGLGLGRGLSKGKESEEEEEEGATSD
jgi:hypothetical protein